MSADSAVATVSEVARRDLDALTAEHEAMLDVEATREGRSRRTQNRVVVLVSVLLAVVVLGVWELLISTGVVHQLVLAAPSDVFVSLADLLGEDYFWGALWFTTKATVVGFVIGSLIGLLLGILLGVSSFSRRVLSPYIIMFQALPRVALAPIFVTAFGFGIESKVVMGVVICFFPVFLDTMTGIMQVSERRLLLMRSMNASRWQTLWQVQLPSALPNMLAGLKAGITMALVGVVIGELVGSRDGIGYLVQINTFQLNVPTVYALIITLGLIGWLLYGIVDFIDRRFVFWRDAGGA